MYSARISRKHPAAFIFLIDQSGSMAETTQFHGQSMSKAEAVSLIVNQLISELLYRSRRAEGYRDYFEIAVLGYHDTHVDSLWRDPWLVFQTPSHLIGDDVERIVLQRERRLPNGKITLSTIVQQLWIKPFAQGDTPMLMALNECFHLCRKWCAQEEHRASYPPTIFNITDGESSDGDDHSLLEMAQAIRGLGTDNGQILLLPIHICADSSTPPVLFPSEEQELPSQRYARLLFQMASPMPKIYNDRILELKSMHGTPPFRGVSYNTGMTDLINMMNIGSISTNLLF